MLQATPALLALWLLVINLRANRCAILDDAFISFRFALNVANGVGLRWNPGEPPVEGASNLFLVMILAAAARLGIDVPDGARVIGVLATIGTAILVAYVCRPLAPKAGVLAGSLVVAFPATAFHALSGLETNLYTFSILAFGVSVWHLDGRRYVTSVVLVLLTFTMAAAGRPEGVAVAGAFLLGWSTMRWWQGAGRPELVLLCLAGGACGAVWATLFAWKVSYFGTLLSPPYWVKRSTPYLEGGIGYEIAFVMEYAPLVLLAIFRLLRGRLHAFEAAAAAVVIAHLVIFSAVEPLMAMEGRYLMPAVPFLIVLAAGPLHQMLSLLPAVSRVIATAAALILLVPQNIYPRGSEEVNVGRLLGNIEPQFCGDTWTGRDRQIGARLRRFAAPSLRVVSEDVGAVGFASGAAVLDPVGLTDMRIARSGSAQQFADAVFEFQPDVVMLRGLTSARDPFGGVGGHGAIGRFGKRAILDDVRFARYVYLGSGPSGGDDAYQWHFWSRPDFEQHRDSLLSFRDEYIDW